MKHKWETAQTCNCGGHTQKCAVCDFGLAFCVKCKGAECQITAECCGRPLTEEEGELICRGDLDYDMGVWFHDGKPVIIEGRGSPMSMADAIVASYKAWERKPADLYPTPVDATESIMPLLRAISISAGGHVDLTGMDGRSIRRVWSRRAASRLARVLEYHGMEVTSTDLRECIPHPGVGGIDFLDEGMIEHITQGGDRYDAIITNPPFSHARQFVEQARRLSPVVIMLVKQNYWNTKGRLTMWDEHRPTFFLPITWRLAFLKAERGNSPLMDCAWCVWIEGMEDECFFEPVRKIVYPGYHDIGTLGAMAALAEACDDLGTLLKDSGRNFHWDQP